MREMHSISLGLVGPLHVRRVLTVLQEAQPLVDVGIAGDSGAHDDVRMAVHVFGQRVHDQIGAQLQRPLQVRREECVVDDDDDLQTPKCAISI